MIPDYRPEILFIGFIPVVIILTILSLVLWFKSEASIKNLLRFQVLITGFLALFAAWPAAVTAYYAAVIPILQAEASRVENAQSERQIGRAIIANEIWDLAIAVQNADATNSEEQYVINVPTRLLDRELLGTQTIALASEVSKITTIAKVYNVGQSHQEGLENRAEILNELSKRLKTLLECISPAKILKDVDVNKGWAKIAWDDSDRYFRVTRSEEQTVGIDTNAPPIFKNQPNISGYGICEIYYN